jgi:hypothetical protein
MTKIVAMRAPTNSGNLVLFMRLPPSFIKA